MALRDELSDTSRDGKDVPTREAFMEPIGKGYGTLADEKRKNPNGLNATRGAKDIGEIVPGK